MEKIFSESHYLEDVWGLLPSTCNSEFLGSKEPSEFSEFSDKDLPISCSTSSAHDCSLEEACFTDKALKASRALGGEDKARNLRKAP